MVKQFFGLLKKSQTEKKEFFYCKISIEITSLILLLEKYGYIRFFIKERCYFKIFVKTKTKHFIVKNLISKNRFIFRTNKLYLLSLKKKKPFSLIILKTKEGLICDKAALSLNSFGTIIAVVSSV